jgi:hypothetical protein
LKSWASPATQLAYASDQASGPGVSNTIAATHDNVVQFQTERLQRAIGTKLIYTATVTANCDEICGTESAMKMSRMIEGFRSGRLVTLLLLTLAGD